MSLMITMMDSVMNNLKRPRIGRDDNQGVTQTFETIAIDVPCCLSQSGGTVQQMYAQRGMFNMFTIWFGLFYPGCEVNDVMTITDRSGIARTFLIRSLTSPLGRRVVYSVDAQLIQEPASY